MTISSLFIRRPRLAFVISTVITIAGQSRKVPLKVKARNLAARRFQFRSSQTVNMTDFGIQPPTVLMGAIKVRDAITIDLDLFVTLSDAGRAS
jgi:polyisoprenoid-binding protein YceI